MLSFHATAFYSQNQLEIDLLPFIWNEALSRLFYKVFLVDSV